jgi:hypothetical protein
LSLGSLFRSSRKRDETGDEVEIHFQHQTETHTRAVERVLRLQHDPDPESRVECSRLAGQDNLLKRKQFLAKLHISSPTVARSRYFDLAADPGMCVPSTGCPQPLTPRRKSSGGFH